MEPSKSLRFSDALALAYLSKYSQLYCEAPANHDDCVIVGSKIRNEDGSINRNQAPGGAPEHPLQCLA